jgi:hypothetical protein
MIVVPGNICADNINFNAPERGDGSMVEDAKVVANGDYI